MSRPAKRLVIVESPAKAKTIAGYLGRDFVVESSIGHIRDLPNRASEIPEKLKKEPWARLGVDVDHDFEPLYVVDADKKQRVNDLKKKLKEVDELLIATDEDREGEAIAWHLLEVLQPKVPVRRMVFHEITKDAIDRALGETREVDQRLVDAQETRRILDRLYGYEVSPVLWKKVMQGLSAGRVQSVAVRLVVERERERRAFVSASYWDLEGVFDPGSFAARLVSLDGKRVAQGRDLSVGVLAMLPGRPLGLGVAEAALPRAQRVRADVQQRRRLAGLQSPHMDIMRADRSRCKRHGRETAHVLKPKRTPFARCGRRGRPDRRRSARRRSSSGQRADTARTTGTQRLSDQAPRG